MSMPPTTGPGVVVDFDYTTAFSRNIGWLTRAEQDKIRDSRIAIAGLGGVGGAHVLSLLRLGIGALNISDFDRFSIENFNRQAGATLTTVGLPKIDCIARMARDINPSVSLRCFERGITDDNLDDFLDGVDIYVDGIDFFAVDVRRKLFAACERKGIPGADGSTAWNGNRITLLQARWNEFRGLLPVRGSVALRAIGSICSRTVTRDAAAGLPRSAIGRQFPRSTRPFDGDGL
jgi:hypothetical protein